MGPLTHLIFLFIRRASPMRLRKGAALCLAILACFTALPQTAAAHSAEGGGVFVDHPVAMPAKAGETSRLRLRLENETDSRLNVVGLVTPVAASTKIMVWVDAKKNTALDSISISPGEELRANTSHMWFELAELTRDLIIGERFPATLKFGGGRELSVDVLVSDTAREDADR